MNASDYIIDIREYDVPYHVRVAIDKGMYKHHEYTLGLLTYKLQRHSHREMVHCGSKARCYFSDLQRRTTSKS